MASLQGIVENIIYRNEQNGYSVIELQLESGLITALGSFTVLKEGEMIEAEGEWIIHKDYGEQFKIEKYKTAIPATLMGMEKYLGSGIISGIGPSTARHIMEHFGTEALQIIEHEPKRLMEIEGIGAKTAQKIQESFETQKEMKDIMLFLEQYDVSPAYAVRIYKEYGEDTIKEIKENPYKLAEDVVGIGFRMADKIAISMGYSEDSDFRVEAAILFILNNGNNGHTFLPKAELIEEAREILNADISILENAIISLFIAQKIVTDKIDDVDIVYITPMYRAEVAVARRLLLLDKEKKTNIDYVEMDAEIVLADRQKEAVQAAITTGVTVITGGPGTGKTTIIKTIIRILNENRKTVLLAAPTGRAAKRMQEATGVEAKTIHRMLEYGSGGIEEKIGEAYFQVNEENPLEADYVIVDEVSMIDILLMNSLLKAIPEGTALILVGDADQLPSVGVGNVLRDIIDSGKVKTVKLDEIFRQARESLIVVNAHKINHGELPDISKKDKDFFFIKEDNQNNINDIITGLCTKRLKKYTGLDTFSGIQVLTPMRKSECGVNNLNLKLQKEINPPSKKKKEKIYRDTIFRQGDKVMQVKNNYKITWSNINDPDKEGEGIFNGDMGIILDMDHEIQGMSVLFDNERLVEYEYNNLDELELAYALTVHKSQGSEFPIVIMPITYGPPMLLTRNLLYTALTRAREMVVLVGNERYLKQMVDNNYINRRHSGLKYRIEKLGEGDAICNI